ncbi:Hypothetical predicted protein [Olea europaea subsp. europaea]|uniref:DUF1764-domain-containing protein n=1 Tax=Olea europaea subsp. europaea TaxID=158383 RepID=A0A8S0RIT5_OLEEU|nr:Hypothetical predicted protein [Olea europaea subsp. europaea]
MTKTSSAKKAKPAHQDHVEQEKSTSKPKKMGSEIDDIFAGKKRKKPEKERAEAKKPAKESAAKAEQHKEMKIKKKRENRIPEGNLFAETPPRPWKKTGDGLTVYTEEELGIGKPDAGGTRLCPFDCNCCF